MTVTLTSRQASDLFRSPPDRFVDVGSAEVAVRSVGEGPDVLFVHGWPASGATWRARGSRRPNSSRPAGFA